MLEAKCTTLKQPLHRRPGTVYIDRGGRGDFLGERGHFIKRQRYRFKSGFTVSVLQT